MDKPEGERSYTATEDAGQLNRNRSFKSKQLVRSQAIRESASPPRTISPAAATVEANNETVDNNVKNNDAAVNSEQRTLNVTSDAAASDTSSHVSDRCSDVISCSDKVKSDYNDEYKKKQPVEIQITPGAWDLESHTEQRQRTKRWLGHRHHSDSSRDLLSNNPRVACVCGSCSACPHCRGRRRRHLCPTKQDSGIVCSDDCPECSDSDHAGSNGDGISKTGSLDVDDQPIYCRCPDRKEKPKSISLSKTDSEDRTEPTGLDLVNFIKETLNKNARDRMTLLKIEKELHSLVNDTGRCIVRFPVMTSYGRMLVHRCAALFQLSHHLDQTNKNCVLVSKSGTSGGRLPCTSFKQWCTMTFPPSPQRHQPDNTLAKSILKRDAQSLEEGNGGARAAARSKSLEQREREYERVRRRIFSTDNCTQDEAQWPWLSAGPVKLLTPETGRNKLLKVQSLESGGGGGGQGWRSRGAVSKSHSFGGYGGTEPPHPRLLSRQGDLASSSWRLSPSSSGYKTLSLRSTDSVTPSPTGGASPEPMVAGNGFGNGPAVVWAVTDLSSVPTGALVIHPQTGRPLTNPDGSVYRFDPANPPILYDANIYMQSEQHKMDQNCEKRRGRLEKQHSFIDHECECQPSDECRNKCCCECRRHDGCNAKNTSVQDKTPAQTEQKNNLQNPTSPCKNRYESNVETPPNHNSSAEVVTNRVPHYEQTTNHRASVSASPNQRPVYESTNQNQDISANQRQYDANNRQFENQQSPSYEQGTSQKPAYDPATNQRPVNDVTTNHRPKLSNQDSQEMTQCVQQQNYPIAFRNEEMTSPPQAMPNQAYIPDMANLQNMMAQAKVTPVPIQDPNLRPMSLTNVVYPTPVAPGYPYINQCRMEPPLQPAVYQAMVQPSEEHKLTPSPHPNESTFRIDPSYQFANAEYAAACGSCAPPIHDQTHPAHRGINVSYGPMELPPGSAPLPAAFPLPNVILPQPIHHYPYQEAMPWAGAISALGTMGTVGAMSAGKVFAAPELCPLVPCAPTAIYPPCGLIYPHPHPQVLPPPYPICQPIYPVLEKPLEQNIRRNSITNSIRQSKRNSVSSSSRNTPLETVQDEKAVPYDNTQSFTAKNIENKPNSNDIAVTIQQIKDQMAQMNSTERDRDKGPPVRARGTDDWKRRNSGNGILGSYPVNNHFNNRLMGRPTNDETQLTSAARAIVNSIRSMQTKNNYQQDRRNNDYVANGNNQAQFQRSISDGYKADRDVQRNRQRDREFENRTQSDRSQNFQPDGVGNAQKMPPAVGNDPSHDRRIDAANRNRNGNPVPFQYRPPYIMRQMSPGTWCRRSPGPVHPVLNNPRRPPPDTRNGRR